MNKNQVEANTFIRLKTGHMFKFGGSSRYFIMQVRRDRDDGFVMRSTIRTDRSTNVDGQQFLYGRSASFDCSSTESFRRVILQGGTKEDEETESELSLTQLKQMRKVREEHLRNKVAEEEERERQAKERDAKGKANFL